MDFLQPVLIILHIVGIALGAGGAAATDATFLRMIWDRRIETSELQIIEIISKVVISGLVLLVISGASMVYLNPGYFSLAGDNAVFLMKMTIVAVLTMNGVAFHWKVLPLLKKYQGKSLTTDEIQSKLVLLAVTGGLSGVSWYSALILGVLMQSFTWPYLLLLNIYLLLVAGAVMSAYAMLYTVLFYRAKKKSDRTKSQPAPANDGNKKLPGPFKNTRVSALNRLIAGLVATAGVAGLIFISTVSEGREHFVCVHEAPPWFSDEVLEIEPGDTVVWHHCGEDEIDYGQAALPGMPTARASSDHDHSDITHGDSDNHDHSHIHTHPILSISGQEDFSSDMAPVGHLEDGREFSHTFEEKGIYEYICPTHPYMRGIIAVGEDAPVDSLWPPEDEGYDEADILEGPPVPGVGDIWLNTQFEHVDGQEFPGTITVLDGETWETDTVITDETFNNPHNLWNSRDGYIFQTQWHSNTVSKIDIESREVVDSVELGNAPAHLFVHPSPGEDKIYVTLNNESRVVVMDSDLEVVGEIGTSFGPHGIWIDPSGRWMSVAATLEEKLDIIDLETEEVVETFEAPGLPLATQITHDGRYAMISMLLEDKVRFIDLETMEVATDTEVGEMPVWAMPGPNGEYVFVPNTATGDVSVISLQDLEVVDTLPAASGAHGISFGKKQDGGYYGYVSNKYARVISVIDVDGMETLGHIELHEEAWGGNGILTVPNNYAEFIP